VRKDAADLSLSDFQPKRFALSYDPPVIVLEYLVPSTGKLYHHKMRLRNLKHDSSIDEMMQYLEKRHPLYFMNRKLSKEQIIDLIKKLQFRLKKDHEKAQGKKPVEKEKPKPTMEVGMKSVLGSNNSKPNPIAEPKKESQFPSFIQGSSLPTMDDNKENKSKVKFTNKFDDDGFDDEFDDDFGDEGDEGEEGDDFDANELLNFSDY